MELLGIKMCFCSNSEKGINKWLNIFAAILHASVVGEELYAELVPIARQRGSNEMVSHGGIEVHESHRYRQA